MKSRISKNLTRLTAVPNLAFACRMLSRCARACHRIGLYGLVWHGTKRMKLPRKLGKEPLIEAIFEVRFTAALPVSSILPGLMFQGLQGEKAIERLPASELPQQLRNIDPNLRYAPLIRIRWPPFTILISDQSVGLACAPPYPGWAAFKPAILKIVEIIGNANVIDLIERFSLKYTNILSATYGGIDSLLDFKLKIGPSGSTGKNVQIRAEIPQDGLIHIVQLLSSGTARLPDGSTKEGVVFDIDTISIIDPTKFSDFFPTLADRVEFGHHENKALFFACLTQKTMDNLEPVYD
jgi:uncharacterized protein (TIGR04255 family)